MAKRIVIDPVTQIEGHLRINCVVDKGKVTDAWASGTMWRGVEQILLGRDPRDAWAITQRFCGVCTTVHAIASVRAVENALQMAQVGPLTRVLVAAASKDEAIVAHLARLLGTVEAIGGVKLPLGALHSTIGRHAARAVMCARNVEILEQQWELLMASITAGDTQTFEKPVFPAGEVAGFGFHEAPRGMLSHWVVIDSGVIKNYQAVVPTTWNAAPRNENDERGPYESSLLARRSPTPSNRSRCCARSTRSIRAWRARSTSSIRIAATSSRSGRCDMAAPGRTVVLGVGNLVMSDEGLGVRCIEHLQASHALPPEVAIIDGGTSTSELLDDLEDAGLLVIVDAVAGSGPPGSLVRVEGDRIPAAFSNQLSPHQHGINDLLATLQFLGRAPGRVVVLGAIPGRIALGLELSAEVQAALPALAAQVVAEVTGAAPSPSVDREPSP